MTISDALPVQFWLASKETYNQKEPQGIFRKCFCQPWKCDDEIKVQLQDTTGITTYKLLALDVDDLVVGDVKFTETVTGVYTASLIPNDYSICDEDVRLFILDTNDLSLSTEVLSNPSFVSSLSPWSTTTYAGSVASWAWASGDKATLTFPSAGSSNWLYQSISERAAGSYYIEANIGNSTVHQSNLIVEFWNNGALSQQVLNKALPKSLISSNTQSFIVYAPEVFDEIRIRVSYDTASSTVFDLFNFSFKPINGELIDVVTAKSDCLNIKSTQDETVLITYSDNKNFASLNYTLVTPDPEFYIRIPAVFFHERFPEESEVIELSNSRSIQLNAQVKAQRQLETGPMPYYMHRKMKLILKHQFVTIDSQDWVQSETYEISDGSRRSPLKKALVWLDEKDYIMRNVL